jgi:hypothetical protein
VSPGRQRVLAWVLLLAGLVALTNDLWLDRSVLFAGRLSTDTMLTAWFHQRVAEGAVPETLDDFDFPSPYETAREFPSTADAVLLRPLVQALGFPGYWNVAVALAVGIAGLGCAAVAGALGAGPRGVLIAGLLGALCRPIWFEALSARFNAIYPGLVLLGAAVGAWAARHPGPLRWPAMGLGVLLGVAGLWVYPPWAVLLLPLLLVLGVRAVRGGDTAGRALLAAGVLVAGGLLAWLLPETASARVGGQQCLRLSCPDLVHSVDAAALVRVAVEPWEGLARGGLYLAPWLLAPLALLRHRWAGGLLLAAALGGALLALGPCPQLDEAPVLQGLYAHDPAASSDLWCVLARVTDYGRFAGAAGLSLAVLSGLGVDALGSGGRVRQGLAWLLGIGAVAWVATVHLTAMNDPRRWHAPEVPGPAVFLQQADPGVAAELPFDRRDQFLGVLAAPGRPRVNPLKARPRPGSGDPVVDWLQALGTGETAPPPTAEALSATEVRWVLWDPSRCGVPSVPEAACDPANVDALVAVLGPSVWAEGGVLAFEVPGEEDARRRGDAGLRTPPSLDP